ncbi:MAG: ACP S-malonyltransferase [Deltaproteobacteria bacterium]|nr:ACP S-malonyltransferase [Deltaproteobacteria bacterium]
MGRDVFEASPAAREIFQTADAALGYSLSQLCFEGPEDALVRTEVQQPAILTTSIALLRAIEERGPVEPAFVAGHSLGEYSALVASGALPFDDAVRLVQTRGRFMQEAVPEGRGAMAAVIGTEREVVERCCAEAAAATGQVVSPANYNSPPQTVIAGDSAAVERACVLAREQGAKRTVPLPVSAPFHCQLMVRAAEKLALELAGTRFADPVCPIVTNVEATTNTDGSRIAALLEQQVSAPVRFVEMVQHLAQRGVTRVLEVGPGRVLTGLVRRIDRDLERGNCSTLDEVGEAAVFAAGS